jgi:hypothetical protein
MWRLRSGRGLIRRRAGWIAPAALGSSPGAVHQRLPASPETIATEATGLPGYRSITVGGIANDSTAAQIL